MGCSIAPSKAGFSIAPSALAYLFADLLEDVSEAEGWLFCYSPREKLPCREVGVNESILAYLMLVAAFVHVAEEGYLKLTLGTKGRILKHKAVFAALQPERPSQDLGGLEAQILKNITGKRKKDDVESIVWRVLGEYSYDPCSDIIRRVRVYLLRWGYFAEKRRRGIAKLIAKKLVPQCDRIVALEGEGLQLRERIVAFRAAQPELYKCLWGNVGDGIDMRSIGDDEEYVVVKRAT